MSEGGLKMNDREIENIAKDIMTDICETDEILADCEMNLFEEGYIDSFAMIRVILEIEEKTGIILEPSDISKKEISSVNNLIKYLKGKLE